MCTSADIYYYPLMGANRKSHIPRLRQLTKGHLEYSTKPRGMSKIHYFVSGGKEVYIDAPSSFLLSFFFLFWWGYALVKR